MTLTDYEMRRLADVICRNCGQKGDKHRSSDQRCPGKGPFPKWPRSIKDDKRAGELFDKRLAKYWSQRKTTFAPSR